MSRIGVFFVGMLMVAGADAITASGSSRARLLFSRYLQDQPGAQVRRIASVRANVAQRLQILDAISKAGITVRNAKDCVSALRYIFEQTVVYTFAPQDLTLITDLGRFMIHELETTFSLDQQLQRHARSSLFKELYHKFVRQHTI